MDEHWEGILCTDSHHVDGGGILIWYFLSVSASFSHYHKTSEIINLQGVHFESPFRRFRSVSTGHVSPGLRGGKSTWWSRTTLLTKLGVTGQRKGRVSQAPPTRHTPSDPSIHSPHGSSHLLSLASLQQPSLSHRPSCNTTPPAAPSLLKKWNFQYEAHGWHNRR